MRVALYARVSTINNGQVRRCSFANCANTASAGSGRSPASSSTSEFRAQKEKRPQSRSALSGRASPAFRFRCRLGVRSLREIRFTFAGALETFKSLGIEFVSLSEQLDTSTPASKMVFTVLGAIGDSRQLDRRTREGRPADARARKTPRTAAGDRGCR